MCFKKPYWWMESLRSIWLYKITLRTVYHPNLAPGSNLYPRWKSFICKRLPDGPWTSRIESALLPVAISSSSGKLGKTVPGGHVIISIRDYDEILKSPPTVTPVRVFDTKEGRRIYFQVWDWIPGKDEYEFQLFLVTSDAHQVWHTKVLSSHSRAWRREPLTDFFREVGFVDVLWHMPAETGHHSPILTGRRPVV